MLSLLIKVQLARMAYNSISYWA